MKSFVIGLNHFVRDMEELKIKYTCGENVAAHVECAKEVSAPPQKTVRRLLVNKYARKKVSRLVSM